MMVKPRQTLIPRLVAEPGNEADSDMANYSYKKYYAVDMGWHGCKLPLCSAVDHEENYYYTVSLHACTSAEKPIIVISTQEMKTKRNNNHKS